jgi:hypothetical protein
MTNVVGVAVSGTEVDVLVGDAGMTRVVGVAVGGLDIWVFVGEAVTGDDVIVAVGRVEVGIKVGTEVDVGVKLGAVVGRVDTAVAVLRVSELPVKTVTYELFLKLPPGLL